MKVKKEVDIRYVNALEAFCTSLIRKHGRIVVSIWLLKNPERLREKDLYVIILLNDIKTGKSGFKKLELDVLEAEKAVSTNLGVRIHSGFYNLSVYFESVMKGDEDIFREIRHSIPVYDPTGFFGPLKKLINTGKIVGTRESLFKLVFDMKERYKDIHKVKMRILDNIYAAVVDSGQAALITAGTRFPIHKDIASGLEKHFVKKHMLEKRYADYCSDIIQFMKEVEHKRIKNMTGKTLDVMIKKGNLFVNRMKDLVDEIEKKTANA